MRFKKSFEICSIFSGIAKFTMILSLMRVQAVRSGRRDLVRWLLNLKVGEVDAQNKVREVALSQCPVLSLGGRGVDET